MHRAKTATVVVHVAVVVAVAVAAAAVVRRCVVAEAVGVVLFTNIFEIAPEAKDLFPFKD